MASEEETPPLELGALPEELLARMLARLPSPADLGRADCVCRAWAQPVEHALRLRNVARGVDVCAPAPAGEPSLKQWLCWLERLHDAPSQTVSAGRHTSAVVDARGRVHMCGGRHEGMDACVATPVPGLGGRRVSAVSAGAAHTLVIADGAVFSFGDGERWQLGHGDNEPRDRAEPIRALGGVRATAVAAGGQHSIVLGVNGSVYSFGDGTYGQLGHGGEYTQVQARPKAVSALEGVRAAAIAAGGQHTLVVDHPAGAAWSFGLGIYGQLGHGDTLTLHEPTPIVALRDVRTVAMAAGGAHSLFLTDAGGVLSCGDGAFGQLGHVAEGDGNGDVFSPHFALYGAHGGGSGAADALRPEPVRALDGVRVMAVAAGGQHSLVLSESGVVFSFGCGGSGRLGHADQEHRREPTPVAGLRGRRVLALAAGGYHSVVITDGGEVCAFGDGVEGQLGQGGHRSRWEPGRPMEMERADADDAVIPLKPLLSRRESLQ